MVSAGALCRRSVDAVGRSALGHSGDTLDTLESGTLWGCSADALGEILGRSVMLRDLFAAARLVL